MFGDINASAVKMGKLFFLNYKKYKYTQILIIRRVGT